MNFLPHQAHRHQRKASTSYRPQVEWLEDRTVPSGMDPTVLISGGAQTPEGQSYLLNLTAVDPENDSVTGWTINWGDGPAQNVVGNPSSIRHTYAVGPNDYNITASAIVDGTSFAAHVADDGAYLGTFVAPGAGGLDFPRWMSFGPDGNLYVASGATNSILRYDGTTGAFVDTFVSGLQGPLAFGADGSLFVGNQADYSIQHFDSSGVSLGTFNAGPGGSYEPTGLVFGPDGNLHVTSYNGLVRRYAGDGTFMEVLTDGSDGSDAGSATLFGPDGNLYVNTGSPASVRRFDGLTGAFINEFIPAFYGSIHRPYGMTFGPDGDFYLTSASIPSADATSENRVVRYDGATGEMIDVYAAGPEQDGPFTAIFGPDGKLYVSSMYNNSILRYSGPLTAEAATQLPVAVLDVAAYSNTTQQNILSNQTILSTITIGNEFTVADVNVTVNIDHSYDRDLLVFLISPAGSQVTLFKNAGGGGDNFSNTIVDDEARMPFERGAAPFTGSFYPDGHGTGALSAFDGQAAQGTWTLKIMDAYSGNTGKLKNWTITLAKAPGGPGQPPPTLSINSVSEAEGKTGTTVFTFTVTLSEASTETVTVNYATANGTASSTDYTSQTGTLTFAPGQTSKTITILVKGDKQNEADETFFVNLTDPINATLSDDQGLGTILNDD